MHTEHLQNVRPVHVVTGWLVAIAMMSLAVLAAIGTLRLIRPEVADIGRVSSVAAVVVGFWIGGFYTGFRTRRAPVLHGIAIGLTSLVAWAGLNGIASLVRPGDVWQGLTPALTIALMLAQIAAAVLGALMGYNVALRGKPSLAEHEPVD